MSKSEKIDRENLALFRELGGLRSRYSLTDKTEENEAIRDRIRELRSILIERGYIKDCQPRANRRPPRVVNR